MSTPAAPDALTDLPGPIVAKLEALIRRMRRVVLLRGLLAVAAVALGTFLALMAVDATVTIFSPAARWLLTLAGLAAVAGAAHRFVARPLRREYTLTAVARMVELQHPELQERISSTVQFLSEPLELGSDRPGGLARGSEQLIAALAEEATMEAGSVDPRKEISARAIRPYLIAAASLAGVFVSLFAIWPRQSAILLTRVLVPTADMGNVHAVDLKVTPGDRVVALGDPVTIEVSAASGDLPDAELLAVDATGHESRRKMLPPAADRRGTASLTIPGVSGDFRYRVLAGGALTRYHAITAVPRPRVEAIELRLEPPAYTGLKPRTVKDLSGVVEAPAETRVTVTASANKPIARPALQWAGRTLPASTPPGHASCSWTYTLGPDDSGKGSIVLEDEHSFASEPAEFELRAIRDRAPTVAITSPREPKLRLNPHDQVELRYQADDDFGLGAIELLVALDGAEATPIPQPLPAAPAQPIRSWAGEAVVNLASMDLGRARQVTIRVRVADTLPKERLGPNRAVSQPLVIEIDRQASSLLTQTADAQGSRFDNELKAILRQLQEAKALSRDLHRGVEPPGKLSDPAADQVDKVRKGTDDASIALRDLPKTWEDTPYANLLPAALKVAEEHVIPARDAAELILLSDEPRERIDSAKQADGHIDRAIAALEALLKDGEKRTQELKELGKLEDLAAKQAQLAEKAPSDPKATTPDPGWREEQQKLARELAEALKANKDALNSQLREEKEQAKKLASEAKDLARDQKTLEKQLGALEDPRADREKARREVLKQLAQDQKQVAEKAAKLQEELAQANPAVPASREQAARNPAESAPDQARAPEKGKGPQPPDTPETKAGASQAATEPSAKPREERKAQAPESARALAQAGAAMQAAREQMARNQAEPAADQARAAEKALEQIAAETGDAPQSPAAPEKKPEGPTASAKPNEDAQDASMFEEELSRQEARELAREQKAIADALDEVKKGNPEGAMARRQAALGEKSKQLQKEAEQLASETDALARDQPAKDGAREAAAQLAQASAQADKATSALAKLGNAPKASRPDGANKGQQAPRSNESTKGEPSAAPGESTKGEPPPAPGGSTTSETPSGPDPAVAEAREAQEKNAQSLAAAAKALDDLGHRLGRQAGAPPAPPPGQANAPQGEDPLASAFQDAASAARAEQPQLAAAAARKASRELSTAANDAARRAGMSPPDQASTPSPSPATAQAQASPSTAQASSQPQPPSPATGQGSAQQQGPRRDAPDGGAVKGDGDMARLKGQGKADADWAKFGGRGNREAADGNQEGTPEDYRDLVKQYFKELSRQGGEPGDKRP